MASMFNSFFGSQKNPSQTLPEGLLSASCNIKTNFGPQVGLQNGPKKITNFEKIAFFLRKHHQGPQNDLQDPPWTPKKLQN